jgi:crotonobetainyl-CoA hydratase
MTVRVDITGAVALITIDRPEVRNAIDPVTAAELDRTIGDLDADGAIRVIVLTGAGDLAFCAGADLKSGAPVGTGYWLTEREHGFGGISHRPELLTPVIARVNGVALGGGFEMVLGCDLAVVADTATFGLPETVVGGMPLDGGIPLLARTIPNKIARDLLLTGRRISAVEAERWGLVNEVVPSAELDAAVERWVERLLSPAPLSQRGVKELLALAHDRPVEDVLRHAGPATLRALESSDAVEGAAAFRERRIPRWTGT